MTGSPNADPTQAGVEQLRGELLDHRAASLNRWLAVVSLVLTFFGIVVVVAGYIGYERFTELDERAESALKRIEARATQADDLAQKIDNIHQERVKTADGDSSQPDTSDAGVQPSSSRPGPQYWSGTLPAGGTETIEVSLDSAGTYWFYGSCEESCTDLDIALFKRPASPSDLLAEDDLTDAIPIVSYDAPAADTVKMEVTMWKCDVRACKWEIEGEFRAD